MSSISKINISDTDYTLNASSINDYNNSATKIQVGFAGAGLTSSNLGYVAGYTADGTKIKDVNKAQMKSWLGLGSAAYANLNTLFNRHLYPSLGSTQTGNTPVWLLGLKSAGYPVYTDPEFANGYNDVYKYANSGADNLAITRGLASDFGITDPGNSSKYVIQIKNTGTVVPGLGGFYQIIYPRANAICIQIFRAMIPSGYSVNVASNSMGTSYQDTWLTSNTGTGKWEWYIRSVHCGSTGTFASGGHVYLAGTAGTTDNPVIWYLSYCNYIDITNGNYDGLRTRYSDSLFTARNLKIGNTSKSFNGSGDVSWSLSEIGCLPLSGGTMSGDIVFQYDAGIRIATDSSWNDSFRSIPFSNTSTPSKIQWYSTNATTGLTFNPNSGTLRTGDFQSESCGFVAPAMGSNPRTTYGASMIFYNCNPDTTSYYNFGVYQWDDEFQFNYRKSATNEFQGNSFTIRGSDGLFCIVNRPVIGSYTSGNYVLHSGDVTGGGSTGGSSLTVYNKTLTIPTSLPASDVYSWAKASTKPSYSWSEITSKPSTFAPSSHTHSYIPLSGGTMTGGQIARSGNGGMWYRGRTSSLLKTTDVTSDGWNVITSLKTKDGDWSMGVLGTENMLRFCYTTDTNFTAGNNDTTHALRLDETGNLITLGSTTSSKFIKSGGTSSQFLKADGSVDSNSYSLNSHTHSVKINGTTKTIAASGGTAVDLGTYLTAHQDISGKADKSTAVTHTASTAVGSSTQPVYIASDGTATAIGYTIAKSVPSNAVFTDTNTNQTVKGNGTAFGSTAVINIVGSGATAVTADTTNNKITISSTNTTYTAGTGISLSGTTFNVGSSSTLDIPAVDFSSAEGTNISTALGLMFSNGVTDVFLVSTAGLATFGGFNGFPGTMFGGFVHNVMNQICLYGGNFKRFTISFLIINSTASTQGNVTYYPSVGYYYNGNIHTNFGETFEGCVTNKSGLYRIEFNVYKDRSYAYSSNILTSGSNPGAGCMITAFVDRVSAHNEQDVPNII
jgi:hypothetical protein